jgi:hypothetical protein
MLYKKIVIIAIIALSIIGVAKLMTKEEPFKELEIEINEAIYPENRSITTKAIIELTVKNDNPYKISLSNAKLISSSSEFELGSIIIEEIIIDANSETMMKIEVLEDWSIVPLSEQDLTPEYSLQANVENIGALEITQIKPLQITISPIEETKTKEYIPDSLLDAFYENIRSGGPPKDGIPPIDEPKYTNVDDADDKLRDQDIVFVMEAGGTMYVYPQKILVWHEIVNDEIDGVKYSMTYCPLTGSAIGYYGELMGLETSFGTSGKLINSNLVMYDRETDSYWPQILGISIRGDRKGESLNTFNVVWSRWELVKVAFPEALVLSDDTGFIRTYGRDPYGLYSESDSYYNTGAPFFQVMNSDPRHEAKEVVIGIKLDGKPYAITKKEVVENHVINIDVYNRSLVAFYNDELDSVNVFDRSYEAKAHIFNMQDGKIIDEETNSVWLNYGICISGEFAGTKLEPVDHFDVMWFGWVAFYPDTGLDNG